jgi:hypothetical protein
VKQTYNPVELLKLAQQYRKFARQARTEAQRVEYEYRATVAESLVKELMHIDTRCLLGIMMSMSI